MGLIKKGVGMIYLFDLKLFHIYSKNEKQKIKGVWRTNSLLIAHTFPKLSHSPLMPTCEMSASTKAFNLHIFPDSPGISF